MKQRFLTLSVTALCLLPLKLAAADTLSVKQKLLWEQSGTALLRNQVWQNSAMRYDLRPFSLTAVSVKGTLEDRGRAALAQEGNEQKYFGAEVSSFVILDSHSRLFGKASYRNGRREDVIWNENSDYSLLYPYVVGDSIGGFMKEEEYNFSGGYAYRLGQWTAGAEFDYRAVIAYRDKDPRPRNIISDLQVSLALARRLSEKYTLGLSALLRKYSQKSDISYLADRGSTSVYQMLGLGMDYVRFAGAQTSTLYSGTGISSSIDLLPASERNGHNGFSASLRMDYLHLTKQLASLNHTPINEIKNIDLALETAWTQRNREWEYGAALLAAMQRRTGVENIFGDPTANVYPLISSVDQFKNTSLKVSLKGVAGQSLYGNRRWGWLLLPTAGYALTKPEYKDNGRYVEIAAASGGLEAQSFWQVSKMLISVSATGGYTANVKSEYALPGLDTRKSAGSTLLSNIDYLRDDHSSFGLKLQGDYVVNSRYAVFLSVFWLHQEYKKCGGTNRMEVSMGISF